MRTLSLFLAGLCVLAWVCYGGALSTCRPVDVDLMRRKRIEAIRGQILSKLRLPKEPEQGQDKDGEKVPTALLAVYNSTVQVAEEHVQHMAVPWALDDDEGAYYAKEVHKFIMKQSKYTVI